MQAARPRRSVALDLCLRPWLGPVLFLTAAAPAVAGLKTSPSTEAKALGPTLVAIDDIRQAGFVRVRVDGVLGHVDEGGLHGLDRHVFVPA